MDDRGVEKRSNVVVFKWKRIVGKPFTEKALNSWSDKQEQERAANNRKNTNRIGNPWRIKKNRPSSYDWLPGGNSDNRKNPRANQVAEFDDI